MAHKVTVSAIYVKNILQTDVAWLDRSYLAISKIELQLSSDVGILTKLSHCLSTAALLTLCYAFMYPHILYGIVLWGLYLPIYIR